MTNPYKDDIVKVDYSSSDTFYRCPRKYFLKFIEGWSTQYGSTALRAGSTFHAGMEGFYSHIAEHGWSRDGGAVERMINMAAEEWENESKGKSFYEDHRTLENVIRLLTDYIDHFQGDHGFFDVLHTERAFKLLITPTEKELQLYPGLAPFYFTGKIDMECTLNGMDWTNEFKTTGWRIDSVVDELNRSPQIMGYAYAKNFVYEKPPEGCLVTVAYFSSRKSPKTGLYGKLTTDFRRAPQIYGQADLLEWRSHFISLVSQIQSCKRNSFYPPRFQNCINNFGRCEFLNLCEQPGGYTKASYNGYVQEEPWDVTKEVSPEQLMVAAVP